MKFNQLWCVYFGKLANWYLSLPGHLESSTGSKTYKSINCTYVAFSPDGREMLANLGGEQIYLYEVENNASKPFRIRQKPVDASLFRSNLTPPVPGNKHFGGDGEGAVRKLNGFARKGLPVHIEDLKVRGRFSCFTCR